MTRIAKTSHGFAIAKGISVVIPTMNRAAVLQDTLRDLQSQSYRAFEVIVVDQSDEPDEAAKALLDGFDVPTRYVFITEFRGVPEARNYGWRQAKHEIVLYTDDDIRCGPDLLQAHFDVHASGVAAMVAGGITEKKGDRTRRGATGSFNPWTATSTRNFHLQDAGYCLHAPGANFSMRREVLEQLQGFDENLNIGAALYEETEFALRLEQAGHRCWFAPEAHLTHLAAPMGGCRVGPDISKYMYGMGHNRAILIHRYLAPWHRLTSNLRLLAYGLSYSRAARSLSPFWSGLRGMRAGKRLAGTVKSMAGKSRAEVEK